MLNFKKEKVNIDDKLKQRIDFICKFCGFKPTFESGYIISLDKTNLYYIEPNKAIIKDILILFFNYSNEVYIKNHLNKLRKYYDVSMTYGKFNQNTNILNFAFNPTHELIRILNDFSKEEVNMGMLSIHEAKLYPQKR